MANLIFTPSGQLVPEGQVQPTAQTPQIAQPRILGTTQTTSQPSAAETPVESGGFIKSILKPFVTLGTQAYAAGRGVVDVGKLLGAKAQGQQSFEAEAQRQQARGEGVNVPLYGQVTPIGAGGETTGQTLLKAAGTGAELASYGMGGGVAKGLFQGSAKQIATKLGLEAVAGAIGSGGQALGEGKTLGEAGTTGVIGGMTSAGLLGVGGALSPLISRTTRKLLPLEKQADLAVSSAVSKAFPITTTKEVGQKAKLDKSLNTTMRIIHQLKPQITDEAGDTVTGTPQTRYQVMQAVSAVKDKLFKEYNDIATKEGKTFMFNPEQQIAEGKSLISVFNSIAKGQRSQEVRETAKVIANDIRRLKGGNVVDMQTLVKDFNSKAAPFLEGGTSKANAQLYATAAYHLNNIAEGALEKSGKKYGKIRDLYSSVKTAENSIAKGAKNQLTGKDKGLANQLTDLLTGQQLGSFIFTGSPTSLITAGTAKASSSLINWLTNPDRYIKNAFKALDVEKTGVEPKLRVVSQKVAPIVSKVPSGTGRVLRRATGLGITE